MSTVSAGVRHDGKCATACRPAQPPLLEAAEKELSKFEHQENEFRKGDRKERAAELRIPLDKSDFN
jgi:hypothetical protein